MAKAFTRINSAGEQDLHDSPQDEEKMRPEETAMDLPDVNDIPGQEHIHVPPLGELADTTSSSDDEEGVGVLDDADETNDEINVSREEQEDLDASANVTAGEDAENLRKAALDNRDDEGEELEEAGFGQDVSGGELDIPGAELDDANEDIGAEDEENNIYSRGGTDNDNINEGTP